MTDTGSSTFNEETLEEAAREEYERFERHPFGNAKTPLPRTLIGLGPVSGPQAEPRQEPTLEALGDTLRFRTRMKSTPPLPPRATRVYQPPTFLVPPPGNTPPDEPSALRSVWVEPDITVVKNPSSVSDYGPAAERARRAAKERRELGRESGSGSSEAPWSTNSAGNGATPSLVSRKAVLAALAASIVVAIAVIVLVLPPSKGRILVTAAGPNNAAIGSAEVVVDGRVVCSTVPCRVDALSRGSHLVRVRARGYERTADQAVSVQSGEDSVIHFNLAGENSAGIDVQVAVKPEVRVILDGVDRGPAPLVLRGLSTGLHTLRLAGSPLHAPFEQQLRLDPAQIVRVEPKLVPIKAVIHVTPGVAALGAWVEIEGGNVRHEIRKLPARIEVAPDAKYRLRAKRMGYRDYETEIRFDDGSLEKVIPIDLAWDATLGLNGTAPAITAAPIVLESSDGSTLGANSIPISNVFIDGRPVGTTPVQIPVTPGSHQVVFVHPTLGRKSVTVEVTSGKPAVAAVRF